MMDAATDPVARAEDIAAINALTARYALVVDDHDMECLADLYTPDAVLVGLSGTIRGRDAIVAYVGRTLDTYDGASIHTPHPGVVDFTGPDTALGVIPSHVEYAQDGVQYVLALRYHDRYERSDDVWLFAERRLEVRYAVPVHHYGTVLTNPIPNEV
ncbi:nuclear transport factor 2 family protein [Rhodococcus pyridinivorans]|uniref:nuclear transport factor 2 family protein n=1 Tax=Rhodococcus pyridinivorans TaxID=103816 RepID=UPI000F23C0D3|nr:nuclear transport factor 2 family protein [Rhodococcus pyridinivorans]